MLFSFLFALVQLQAAPLTKYTESLVTPSQQSHHSLLLDFVNKLPTQERKLCTI